jgi:ubiquinone/menaquinone biosynthesis C-methylase UbiE
MKLEQTDKAPALGVGGVTADPASAGALKSAVRDFWEQGSCGEVYAEGDSARERFEAQARARYRMEPFIFPFARFAEGAGKDVLEIGVGMGADHVEWARSHPRSLNGVDLTQRAVDHTRARVELYGLSSTVQTADAEHLPFADESFDIVYSWGVLHCTPDTPRAIREVWRVLRPGGSARIMVYNRHSLLGYMLWTRYALLKGRLRTSLDEVYAEYLESPGTKVYNADEARALFRDFSRVTTSVELSNGDLLEGEAGQRHHGALLSLGRRVWPRGLVRRLFPKRGLFLMIDAVK